MSLNQNELLRETNNSLTFYEKQEVFHISAQCRFPF